MKTPAELDENYRELLEEQRKNSAAREKAVAGLAERLRTQERSSVKSVGSLEVDRRPGTPDEMHRLALERERRRESSPPSREAAALTDIDDRARELVGELRIAGRRASATAVEANRAELTQVVAAAASELSRRFEAMAKLECARFDLSIPGTVSMLPSLFANKLGLGEAVLQLVNWRTDGWLPDLAVLSASVRRLVEGSNANSIMGSWGLR